MTKTFYDVVEREDLARLRFIADQYAFRAFWGSNQEEEDQIKMIEAKMEKFIFADPPRELIHELAPTARELLSSGDFGWETYLV